MEEKMPGQKNYFPTDDASIGNDGKITGHWTQLSDQPEDILNIHFLR